MSVAVIQGASGGIGRSLASHILRNTGLKVYALTSGKGQSLEDHLGKDAADRLTVVDGVDIREEGGLEKAAKMVQEREGKGSVRLVACMAGILRQEKSLSQIKLEDALETYRINTIGHLLTYKHFVPLIPTNKELSEHRKAWEGSHDPAKGLIGSESSVCWSQSARVGSIADNEKGGWYSYRSSKAALNQIVRTLDHELINKSSSGVAVAYHPGTVLTDLSRPVVGQKASAKPDQGVFEVDQAIEHLTKLMAKVKRSDEFAGGFFDWSGKKVEW